MNQTPLDPLVPKNAKKCVFRKKNSRGVRLTNEKNKKKNPQPGYSLYPLVPKYAKKVRFSQKKFQGGVPTIYEKKSKKKLVTEHYL